MNPAPTTTRSAEPEWQESVRSEASEFHLDGMNQCADPIPRLIRILKWSR